MCPAKCGARLIRMPLLLSQTSISINGITQFNSYFQTCMPRLNSKRENFRFYTFPTKDTPARLIVHSQYVHARANYQFSITSSKFSLPILNFSSNFDFSFPTQKFPLLISKFLVLMTRNMIHTSNLDFSNLDFSNYQFENFHFKFPIFLKSYHWFSYIEQQYYRQEMHGTPK